MLSIIIITLQMLLVPAQNSTIQGAVNCDPSVVKCIEDLGSLVSQGCGTVPGTPGSTATAQEAAAWLSCVCPKSTALVQW
jgi:hypothetical protein